MKRFFNNKILLTVFSVLLITAAVFGVANSSNSVFAKSAAELACEGTGATYDAGTKTCGSSRPLFGSGSFASKIINTLLFLVGGAAVIMVIIGGIRYVISAGDQNAVTAAKNTILYAIMGLVIAMLAYALVRFIVSALS
ncbi:hypothetical protein KBF61_03435 [Candidatus Saccharibacteria bacterium]|jgi:hypothetical protein|nr:hypothetical protein [Candidatus Saccharibacteria bacterium]